MKISNLRKEQRNGLVYLVADVECGFSKSTKLWFSLDEKDGYMFADDVYDAYMMAALFPCMYYNENLAIEGSVSKELYYNLVRYVPAIIKGFRPEMNDISISVDGFAVAQQNEKRIVGTGFSGGVDSFATIVDHYVNEVEPDYKINHLFFFNLGQYGDMSVQDSLDRAKNRYLTCKKATDEIGLPFSFLNTNLFDFYKPEWEHLADELNRATAVLAIQRACRRFYNSSAHTYAQHELFYADHNADIASYSEHMLTHLLSNENCKFILDGAQMNRLEKIENIKGYLPALKHLNVCTNTGVGHTSGNNCSVCGKCQRTMCELELLGILSDFSSVFDIENWRKKRYTFLCSTYLSRKNDIYASEIIKFAKSNNVRLPFYIEALIVSTFMRAIGKIKRTINR